MSWIKSLYLEYQIRRLEKDIQRHKEFLRTCNKYEAIPVLEDIAYLNRVLGRKKMELLND